MLRALKIVVITATGEYPGNHALGPLDEMWLDGRFMPDGRSRKLADVPVGQPLLLGLRCPVFTVGEILILDASGREVGGRGRKPSKWDVEVEYFDDLGAAVRRAREVSLWMR